MPCRPIVQYPDARLKTACAAVDPLDDHTRQVAADLRDTLAEAVGTGIAAPQIGELVRVIYLDSTRSPKYAPESHGPLLLINPVIVEASGTKRFREGCLSLPDFTATVKRHKRVVVEAVDLEGRPLRVESDGFEAILLQHEIDHLDGILFVDRAEPGSRRLRQPSPDEG